MKYFFSFLLLATVCSFGYLEEIYTLSVNTLEGKNVDLGTYRGKKLLIVILPLSAQDTTIKAGELQALQNRYDTSLVVIGIPAHESGYAKTMDKSLKALYKSEHPNFFLSEGMKVKKSAGAQQAPLFQWLTDRAKNRHFDQDVQGPGHKFFVDERGELYAVMGPRISLSHPVIERILSKPLSRVRGAKPAGVQTTEKSKATTN